MSRAAKRKRKIERAKQPMGNMPSYSNNAIQQQIAQLIAKTQSGPNNILYSPGIPLQTQPGVNPDERPRQWSFPIAINTSGVNRSLGNPDIPSFQQLRMLSKMYSGITLPERVWLDMVHGLKLTIGLRPELKAEGMNDSDPEIQKKISEILTFFERPDRRHDLHSWLKMMIRDQTQIDEMYLYKRRNRDGSLCALEVVDGSTMKPLLDDWGRIPEPPLAAYQQFPWGLPGQQYVAEGGETFSTADMIHYQETPQTDSPYGFGRVERFMMEVNQALRKKKRDLAMFTEGNIPTGIMEVPAESVWTPDQIEVYEQLWNALIAGNVQQQVRIKFTQPGMKYVPTDKGDILTDFDYFLYKVSCGVYGISLADIGFVEDIHKSSDQGQQNMMYRRTLFPIVSVYAHNIITSIIRDEFHEDRLEASFVGYEEEEDFNTQAQGFQILANIGAISPSDIAHKMGLPDVPKTGPFILGKDGPIWLKDYEEGSQLRTLQQQSQVAGLQFAAQNPGGPPQPQEGEESDSSAPKGKEDKNSGGQKPKDDKPSSGGEKAQGDKLGEGKAKATGDSKGDGAKDASASNTSKKDDTKKELKRAVDAALEGKPNNAIERWEEIHGRETDLRADVHGDTAREDAELPISSSPHRDGTHDKEDNSKRAELRRWRTRAMSDIERGRSIRPFESDILTLGERTHIQTALERAASAEHVKEIFRAAQYPDYIWQDSDPFVQKSLATMRAKGVTKLKWLEHNGACEECMHNAGKIVDIGSLFPTGVYSVPNHEHCMCGVEEIYE